VSRDTDSIIKYLKMLCKTEVPAEVENYIRSCTQTFGKAKLVLKDNKYFIESKFPDVLRELLKNPVINAARVQTNPTDNSAAQQSSSLSSLQTTNKEGFVESLAPVEDSRNVDFVTLDEDDANANDDELMDDGSSALANASKTVSFMVNHEMLKVGASAVCTLAEFI
jgi:DNA excision repair protein ERCC-3